MSDLFKSIYFHINKHPLIVLFILIFLSLFVYEYHNITTYLNVDGDIAADMLLTNKVYQEFLLTGHYSRFQFNHPGPFFFYINAFFEKTIGFILPSRINAWYFGSITINAIFLILSTKILLTTIDNEKNRFIYSSFFILLTTVSFLKFQGLWMPNRLVIPYFLFLLTMPMVMQRKYEYLPLSLLMTGILIHGYVVQPIMTLPVLIFSFIFSLYYKKLKFSNSDIRYIFSAFLIGLIFVFPMIYDFIINTNKSNVIKILNVASQKNESSSWAEVFMFVANYYKNFFTIEILLLVIIGLFSYSYNSLKLKVFFVYLFVVNIIVTLIFITYYHSAPKPLYEFIGRYYYSVPVTFYTVLILIIFNASFHKRFKIIVTILLIYIVYNSNYHMPEDNSKLHIEMLSKAIIDNTKNDKFAYIDYDQHTQWPQVAGIIVNLSNKKYQSCTTWRDMDFLYTKKYVCKEGVRPNIKLVTDEDCYNDCYNKCVFIISGFGILSKESILPESIQYLNWSRPEKNFRWSKGKLSSIKIKLDNNSNIKGFFSLHAGTLGRQEIKLTINDHYIGSQIVNSSDINLIFKFNPSILRTDIINTIEFEFPNAHRPDNGDQRVLAMALKSFLIE